MKSRVQSNFITNLKRLRREKGITQERLAELCDLTTAYIGEIEIGRKFPSHQAFDRISEVLKTKPYKLLLDQEDIEAFDREELLNRLCESLEHSITYTIREEITKFKIQ